MKYFYVKVFVLICFIIGVSCWTTYVSSLQESFETNKNKAIVLLGDSILKNNSYVSNGKGIDQLLEERNKGKVYSIAKDHSKIVDIYSQMDTIPTNININSTILFLSAGGNDILSFYVDKQEYATNDTALNPMFSAYKKLVESIHTKMDKISIVLLDIYYPENITYTPYHSIIREWNKKVYEYANQNNYKVLKISQYLTQKSDFTMGIEPSSTGGEKIAELILSN